MSAPDSTTTVEPNANRDVIAGLREVADFLEAHPELPTFHAHVARPLYSKDARAELTKLAVALGDRARESIRYDRDVTISGRFAAVEILAYTEPKNLGGIARPRPEIEYEPIIARDPEAGES